MDIKLRWTVCLPRGWCRKPACRVWTSMAPGLGICTRLALISSSIRSCSVQSLLGLGLRA